MSQSMVPENSVWDLHFLEHSSSQGANEKDRIMTCTATRRYLNDNSTRRVDVDSIAGAPRGDEIKDNAGFCSPPPLRYL